MLFYVFMCVYFTVPFMLQCCFLHNKRRRWWQLSCRVQSHDCVIISLVSPPLSFVNRHMSTMWFIVCWWPQKKIIQYYEQDLDGKHLMKYSQLYAIQKSSVFNLHCRYIFTRESICRVTDEQACFTYRTNRHKPQPLVQQIVSKHTQITYYNPDWKHNLYTVE